jgi:hypothetical protein
MGSSLRWRLVFFAGQLKNLPPSLYTPIREYIYEHRSLYRFIVLHCPYYLYIIHALNTLRMAQNPL